MTAPSARVVARYYGAIFVMVADPTTEAGEVRVRWSRTGSDGSGEGRRLWRCDDHGTSGRPECPHTRRAADLLLSQGLLSQTETTTEDR